MKTSEQIDQIAAAMALAQTTISNPEHNKHGQSGGGKFPYADLGSVTNAIREHLAANGLSVIQGPNIESKTMITRVVHKSGQWIETSFPFDPFVKDMKTLGANVTYIRRYSLCAMFMLFGETDNDAKDEHGRDLVTGFGKKESKGTIGTKGTKPHDDEEDPFADHNKEDAEKMPITDDQIAIIEGYFKEMPDLVAKVKATYNFKEIRDLDSKAFALISGRLKASLARIREEEEKAIRAREEQGITW